MYLRNVRGHAQCLALRKLQMPLVKISMLKIWDNNQKRLISDKIHESLVEAFKIPDDDYNHQIIEFTKDNFIYEKNKTEKYILIEMTIFPGRSKNAKKTLYKIIVEKLSELNISPTDITIVLNEPSLENWGLSGKSGDETDIGFNLNV
jgi:phenylpyruvate tautomerase PptA (4-oxalocrotonate tautomerase family)